MKYYLFVMINTLQIKTDVFNKLKYTNLSFYFSWQLKSNSTVLFIHFDICVKSLMYNNYNVQYQSTGFAPIFPDTCYHLTHYWPAAADIPV
ncbi:UNVERIFIED_CONTAM: hypothetical protein PO322_17105, partial [Escherichia coli]